MRVGTLILKYTMVCLAFPLGLLIAYGIVAWGFAQAICEWIGEG